MKRVVSSSFITLLIIVAVAATFFYLKNARNQGGDPIQAIPADVVLLISYDPASEKLGELLSMESWQLLNKVPVLTNLGKQLVYFDTLFKGNSKFSDFLSGQPLFLTGHVTGAGKFDFIFFKSLDNGYTDATTEDMMKSITGSENDFVKRNYDGNIIREVNLEDGRIFSFVTAKGIFIGSFTSFLVEDALRQLKLGKPVLTNEALLHELRSSEKATLCINFKNLPLLSSLFLGPVISPAIGNLKSYGDWGFASVLPQKHKLQFSGFLTESDSAQFVHCFSGQQPVDKKLIQILPRKTAVINYFGTNDFARFYEILNSQNASSSQQEKKQQLLRTVSSTYNLKLEPKMLEWIGNEFALVVTEPAGLNFENNSFAVFKAKNIGQAKKALISISRIIDKKNNAATMEESYNGHSIGFIRLTGVLPAMFGETFNKVTKMYYTDIEDYIVFANQASGIRSFIDEYKSGLLLHKTDFFQSVTNSYPAKGNHFFYIRPQLATQIFKSMANEEWKKNLDQYKEVFNGISSYSFQVSAGDTLFRFASLVDFFSDKTAEGVDLIFAVEADTTVSMKPLITTDPVSKTRQIIFQDDAGSLYLTDNSGNILWKQKVDGQIMGDIFEIDLFKNNTRQFLFNTKDYLFLIDATGSPVGNYPIRLPAPATNGISVFDFDKNEDYKIYIACDNHNIYGYMPSGKPLPGWAFQNTLEVVTTPVTSVVVNGKNILIIRDEEGALAMVNRFGEPVITVGKEVRLSENSGIFETKAGSLITTDASGSIIEMQMDGNVKTTPIDSISAMHAFVYADADGDKDQDYIFFDNKILKAYSSDMSLIYRKEFDSNMSGGIQLLTLKNGVQVMGLRSAESDKIWLIKPDGTVYNGFPVKGSTKIVIDELNMNGNKQMIAGGREHFLYVYAIE